jgi:hypothetical protein
LIAPTYSPVRRRHLSQQLLHGHRQVSDELAEHCVASRSTTIETFRLQ